MSQIRLQMILLFNLFTALSSAHAQYNGPYHSIDLRDLAQPGVYPQLPSETILKALETRPCQFLAAKQVGTNRPNLSLCDNYGSRLLSNPNIKFTAEGALGPIGHIVNERFVSTDKQEWTRKDVIFSAEFDGENSVQQISNGVYQSKLILFVHDSQRSSVETNQYYFRRLTVQTNSAILPIDNPDRTTVVSIDADIPVTQTSFEVLTDIVDRKVVLLDRLNNIKKVFPVGVGAFDIRTLPRMDNVIASMTEELKTQAVLTTQPGLGTDGKPYENQMMKERNYPSWYKGRPFLGILDENGTKYKEIGFHYQIDDGELNRGFISHGCIRVRDKDLYQMSALVFSSGQTTLPVKVVNSFSLYSELNGFSYLQHPYKKNNSKYKRIIYADRNYMSDLARSSVNPSIISIRGANDFTEVERFEWCRQNGKYDVIRYHGPWASVLGTDCLTRITTEEKPVDEVLNAMLRLSHHLPQIAPHQLARTSNYGSRSSDPLSDALNSILSPANSIPTPPAQAPVGTPAIIRTVPIATPQSSSSTGQPQNGFNPYMICDYSLRTASNLYRNSTGQPLTYSRFAELCGCPMLSAELIAGNYRDGQSTYNKICSR